MSDDLAAIKAVLQTYFDGMYEGDIEKLRAAFHPTADLRTAAEDGTLAVMPRAAWFDLVQGRPSPKSRDLPATTGLSRSTVRPGNRHGQGAMRDPTALFHRLPDARAAERRLGHRRKDLPHRYPLILSSSETHRPVPARRAIALVFWASGFDTGTWASQIPRVKLAFWLTDSGIATVVLSFALGAILTMPLTGALTTRFGGVRTVIATGLASAASLVLLGAASTYAWLLAATLFTGVAIGGLDVAMNTQATVIQRAWGSPIMSGIHGWFSLGGLAGAAVGGTLTEASLSFQSVLVVAAALKWSPSCRRALADRRGETTSGRGLAWPRRAALGIGLLCLLAFLVEGAVFDWTAVYMHEVDGASLGLASGGLAGFSLSMAATRFAGDAFTRRFGPARVLVGGAGVVAVAITLACAVPDPLVVTVCLTVAGFGQANVVPLLFSAAGRVPGVAPGAGIATATTMGYGAFLARAIRHRGAGRRGRATSGATPVPLCALAIAVNAGAAGPRSASAVWPK